jgi:hypothetical protein
MRKIKERIIERGARGKMARRDRWNCAIARACLTSAPAWAQEAFQVAKDHAYGQLPAPNARGSYRLTDAYVTTATEDVSEQISKAGVRLAFILNRALRRP